MSPMRSLLALIGLSVMLVVDTASAAAPAALPNVSVDTTFAAPTGAQTRVPAGSSLQQAINAANLGDTLVLDAGAVYTGPITLPNKAGNGWIYIVSSKLAELPPAGTRVTLGDAPNMPVITGTVAGGSAIRTASGAHHYRFVGVEVRPVAGSFLYNLISIGSGDTTLDTLPHHIVFDRCYVHGDPAAGGRRGIAMNGTHVAIVDSRVSDFKEQGADTQALWAHNTPGPIKIQNNYLEAAGENVMFGGSDPSIPNIVPSDIEIRGNHFFKPLSWMGTNWAVKNLFELKSAQRVLIEGNKFENNWPHAQNGFAILFTVRNQDGGAPWSVVQDVTMRFNFIDNVAQGFNISGRDDLQVAQVTSRINISNNFIRVTGLGNAQGRLFQIVGGPSDVVIDHNTASTIGAIMMAESVPLARQFVFTNNIVTRGSLGFIGTGTGDGTSTLTGHFYSDYVFSRNAIIGGTASRYPSGNFFPATVADVGYADAERGDFSLSPSSPYKGQGTDGLDLGANFTLLRGLIDGLPLGVRAPVAPAGLQVQ